MPGEAVQLREMIKPYEGARHTVVAACLGGEEHDLVTSGQNETGAPWEDLVFEIGSLTKVFTATLLCALVEDGKVDPRAPVSELSDELLGVPAWITPERLVSHTSGLPNLYVPLWKALLQQTPEGPYAGFSRHDLLTWMQGWRGKDPGSALRHRYSNLGFGLLGEAMALSQGKPFADLLGDMVLTPLGLRDTTGELTNAQRARFMQPRHTNGKPATRWTFDALAGAGHLASTVRDLSGFSNRVMRAISAPDTTLDRAIGRACVVLFGLGRGQATLPLAQCAGWMSLQNAVSEPRMFFANGGTAGSTCALFVCPERRRAIVILSNNGVAANLWASAKLGWSDPTKRAYAILTAP